MYHLIPWRLRTGYWFQTTMCLKCIYSVGGRGIDEFDNLLGHQIYINFLGSVDE